MKDDDGWIEWHGGDCPVPAGTLVDVRFRNSKEEFEQPTVWRWAHFGGPYDIVAYRISTPAEPPKPDTSAEDALWHEYAKGAMQRRIDTLSAYGELAGVVRYAADMADAMIAEAKKRGRV